MGYGGGFRPDPQGRMRWSENGRWTDDVRDPDGTVRKDGRIPASAPPSTPPMLGVDPPRRSDMPTRSASSGPDLAGAGGAVLGATGCGGLVLTGVVMLVLMAFVWQLRWVFLALWLALPVVGVLLRRRGRLRGWVAIGGVAGWLILGLLVLTGFQIEQGVRESERREVAEAHRSADAETAKEIGFTRDALAGMGDDGFCRNTFYGDVADALAAREQVSSCSEAVESITARIGPEGLEALRSLEMTRIRSYVPEREATEHHVYRLGGNPLGWSEIEVSHNAIRGFVIHAFA
ncbi:hypothetical protein [Nonomuraea sp. NPDC048826]|uniref:hypothetical protein n=1 Tax=Nonomuraea sp. NPDC048826 TaxID=3364347 RepID=UPI003721A5C6